jgi:hypothetical protein
MLLLHIKVTNKFKILHQGLQIDLKFLTLAV